MKALIYKQSYDNIISREVVTPADEYLKIKCSDCDGSRIFHITDDDSQPCNVCKTSGKLYANLI